MGEESEVCKKHFLTARNDILEYLASCLSPQEFKDFSDFIASTRSDVRQSLVCDMAAGVKSVWARSNALSVVHFYS